VSILELVNVTKKFGGLSALHGVSLRIEEGEIVGLIGPNGSGKSTAFNVITGYLPPSSGTIRFRGEDITRLSAHQVARRGMARTFQLVRPFLQLTALENVTAGALFSGADGYSRREAERRAHEVLERVGLDAKADVKAIHLTIIERKWLEIARALAGQPKLLLLDEFMAGLSTGEIPRALELIRSLSQTGITLIVVEHIIKAITSTCGRVIVLSAGEMLADGAPADIVHNQEVIDAYLGSRHAHSH
jgi:branched-chain amino acid transport system ATP-binding protein